MASFGISLPLVPDIGMALSAEKILALFMMLAGRDRSPENGVPELSWEAKGSSTDISIIRGQPISLGVSRVARRLIWAP
jgi:hypothetical protein